MTLSLPCTLKGRKGRYQVLSKMTEGGMSTIYVGKSNRGVPVIVKEASGVDLAQSEERLRIEAEILRTLSSPGHPRVVRYLDVGSNLGPFCLVEEQLEGETLAELYKDKPADAATATRHIVQLLEALSYLHARNVIHRDVKPKNIILDARREVVLLDFGAAKKEFHQFTGSGTVIYTPGWGAPEQNLGEATPASDLYSVGAVLFFLLTAKDPQASMKQLAAGKSELFRSPRDLEPSVPQELSEVVTRAMSFDPKERFPTAADMAQAISGGSGESLEFPHLVVLGKKCRVKREMEIGRDHKSCDQGCTKKGFGHPPEIGILDTERYLSKHHARILKDGKGRCWIEDLGSLNGTAMSHDGGRTYRQIPGFKREKLTDGDVVALVYKPGRGPYMTIAFKGGRRRGGR
ncbi:hypothetical protein AUG86_03280 [Euryarchaeota archaeon 13_1_20CM_4_64_14]|nr:MAG: hypothetical protein AUG86_03280 [Euryarchaeota archaeon 13_1_20CM_4_64_14]TLZ79952.1 MAG: FHA domain-containing protein [Euryarchaeota archaeon]TLZ90283.1 MAG: FHA domain-containing protein [Euryarchaeota archaeon]